MWLQTMIWLLSFLLRTLAKGWFHQCVIHCAHCITFSLLSSFSFPYLLVMMFLHHLLLYNWNCTERGALWITMKIHKIHQNILFKHKKTQFRLSEIWHWTSVRAFAAPVSVLEFLFLFLNIYCPLSISQVHFLLDWFLSLFLILPIPCVRTLLFLIFFLCLTLSLPIHFTVFLTPSSFLLSLLPSLTAPGAQLWPLVTAPYPYSGAGKGRDPVLPPAQPEGTKHSCSHLCISLLLGESWADAGLDGPGATFQPKQHSCWRNSHGFFPGFGAQQ